MLFGVVENKKMLPYFESSYFYKSDCKTILIIYDYFLKNYKIYFNNRLRLITQQDSVVREWMEKKFNMEYI